MAEDINVEELMKEIPSETTVYVVVGFKVNSRRSVYYRVCSNEEELSKAVVEAFAKRNSDFISVRKVIE